MPEGIVITFGSGLIKAHGDLKTLLQEFHEAMNDEDGYWMHWSAKGPSKKMMKKLNWVYIIIGKKVRYQAFFGGYKPEDEDYPGRLIVAGPIQRIRSDRELIGFRGFRYCTKLF